MTNISKRFEQLVTKTYREFLEQGTILPSRSDKGIHVGDVLIQSDGSISFFRHEAGGPGKDLRAKFSLSAASCVTPAPEAHRVLHARQHLCERYRHHHHGEHLSRGHRYAILLERKDDTRRPPLFDEVEQ